MGGRRRVWGGQRESIMGQWVTTTRRRLGPRRLPLYTEEGRFLHRAQALRWFFLGGFFFPLLTWSSGTWYDLFAAVAKAE